jgi:hypothetical protein
VFRTALLGYVSILLKLVLCMMQGTTVLVDLLHAFSPSMLREICETVLLGIRIARDQFYGRWYNLEQNTKGGDETKSYLTE